MCRVHLLGIYTTVKIFGAKYTVLFYPTRVRQFQMSVVFGFSVSTVGLFPSTVYVLPLSFHHRFCLRFRNNEIYDGQQGGKNTFYTGD